MAYSDVPFRFWEKVLFRDDGCWEWMGIIATNGYGRFHDAPSHQAAAHRFVYERAVAPIPDGLQVDHLCRVRACVNPAHLEPVTGSENQRRAAASRVICQAGRHPKKGVGSCAECIREGNRRRWDRWQARAVA